MVWGCACVGRPVSEARPRRLAQVQLPALLALLRLLLRHRRRRRRHRRRHRRQRVLRRHRARPPERPARARARPPPPPPSAPPPSPPPSAASSASRSACSDDANRMRRAAAFCSSCSFRGWRATPTYSKYNSWRQRRLWRSDACRQPPSAPASPFSFGTGASITGYFALGSITSTWRWPTLHSRHCCAADRDALSCSCWRLTYNTSAGSSSTNATPTPASCSTTNSRVPPSAPPDPAAGASPSWSKSRTIWLPSSFSTSSASAAPPPSAVPPPPLADASATRSSRTGPRAFTEALSAVCFATSSNVFAVTRSAALPSDLNCPTIARSMSERAAIACSAHRSTGRRRVRSGSAGLAFAASSSWTQR